MIQEEGKVTKFDRSVPGVDDFEAHRVTRNEVTVDGTVRRDRFIENDFIGTTPEFYKTVSADVSSDRAFDDSGWGVLCCPGEGSGV